MYYIVNTYPKRLEEELYEKLGATFEKILIRLSNPSSCPPFQFLPPVLSMGVLRLLSY